MMPSRGTLATCLPFDRVDDGGRPLPRGVRASSLPALVVPPRPRRPSPPSSSLPARVICPRPRRPSPPSTPLPARDAPPHPRRPSPPASSLPACVVPSRSRRPSRGFRVSASSSPLPGRSRVVAARQSGHVGDDGPGGDRLRLIHVFEVLCIDDAVDVSGPALFHRGVHPDGLLHVIFQHQLDGRRSLGGGDVRSDRLRLLRGGALVLRGDAPTRARPRRRGIPRRRRRWHYRLLHALNEPIVSLLRGERDGVAGPQASKSSC
ncbi:hypothetical protein BU14_0248s0001 [Porphyra umbilicalis]|uniref:Uncharacterized protein n=1 Tax=Porphyra umbilicalis TaxID=2786 RepID=A0A1X6P360_PORUM|nr:hypothetical protein BU14_0248s0001 [Porphyra umbilicalis]|eukprot:OSX75195.1 hypothetical protein BU14_0248s0001 [Porphyra umbilicalis]